MPQKLRTWIISSMVILILLVGSFLVGRTVTETRVVNAQNEISSDIPVSPSGGGGSRFLCKVDSVAVYENRIHIRCNPANGSIAFFAYATDATHSQNANRILTLANTAFALGKSVYADYIDDPAFNPPSCQTSDCRGLIAITVLP